MRREKKNRFNQFLARVKNPGIIQAELIHFCPLTLHSGSLHYIVWVIYLQTGSSLITWLGDVAAVEDEPEKRLACWWLNCSGILARYGRCLRYAYIVRYSGFANTVRDSVLRPFTMRNRNFHRRWNLKAIATSLLAYKLSS